MCPHMNFGITMSVDCAYDSGRIKESFRVLAANHPFLRAVLGFNESENSYYYDVTDSSKIELTEAEDTLTGTDDPILIQKYELLTGYDWDIRKEGMLKAVVWKLQDKTVLLLVFHHLLADGRGALNLARELAEFYVEGKIRKPVSEKLISSVEDLPKDSKMPLLSRMLVDKANRDWEKEDRKPLSYDEYHQYADEFVKSDKTDISVSKISSDEFAKMREECRSHSVTVNDLLMAKMYLEDKTDKIIIAKDVRDELPVYNSGALGNYSTAFGVTVKKQSRDIWRLAEEVHKKVRKTISDPRALYLVLQCYARLNPAVLDAALMAAKDEYDSRSAAFIGRMFFGFETPKGYSITNLGKVESKSIVNAFFIPPASPAIRRTVGVLTVNGEMTEIYVDRK
jgi:NRPS condensation-like uncharacterized protein